MTTAVLVIAVSFLTLDTLVWLVVYRRTRDVVTTNLTVAGCNITVVIALQMTMLYMRLAR